MNSKKLSGEKKITEAQFKRNIREIEVARLFEETCSGYSFDRYGEGNWRASIRMLLDRGFDHRATQAIMLSKWTRWAGDAAGKDSRVNSLDLARFIDSQRDVLAQVDELVVGTFGAAS
jgi:hypothetical protein